MIRRGFFCAGVVFLCATINTMKRASTYKEVMEALLAGHQVRLVMYYALCQLRVDGENVPAPDAIGGMEIKTWEHFAQGVIRNERAFVSTSETILISHPRQGHVFNYVRVRIYDDSTVEITARYLKTSSYDVIMDEMFSGKLSRGKDQNGVHCFIVE
jgi:hypothetical protein